MKARGVIMFIIGVAVLAGLYLVSSTDLVLKEGKTAVHSLSVLIPEENDDLWGNFKKGMDRAAIEYNVDLSFVTLYERGSAEQQGDMLLRELENSAQALIVAPADNVAFARNLEDNSVAVPVVSIYSRVATPRIKAHIGADCRAVGTMLAQAVTEDLERSKAVEVIAVSSLSNRSDISDTFHGLSEALSGSGLEIEEVFAADEAAADEIIWNFDPSAGQVLVALDARSLQILSQRIRGMEQDVGALYGVGCTTGILRALEDGVISAAVVVNDYSAGYMSVKVAVEYINGGSGKVQPDAAVLESRIIRADGIYTKENEMLLFPVF